MSLLILTSKSLKTLTDTDQLKCLFTESTQLLVTDLALHNLQSEAGFEAVKDFIDRGLISVINTVSVNKFKQYKEISLNIEVCSIRNVIDIYAEKEVVVTILVDDDWVGMKLDNIQIISTTEYLSSNQVAKKSVRQATFLE